MLIIMTNSNDTLMDVNAITFDGIIRYLVHHSWNHAMLVGNYRSRKAQLDNMSTKFKVRKIIFATVWSIIGCYTFLYLLY